MQIRVPQTYDLNHAWRAKLKSIKYLKNLAVSFFRSWVAVAPASECIRTAGENIAAKPTYARFRSLGLFNLYRKTGKLCSMFFDSLY